jgi:serine O-acetyltransferase
LRDTATPDVWAALREAAEQAAEDEPSLAHNLHRLILEQPSFEEALALRFASALNCGVVREDALFSRALEAYAADPAIVNAALEDFRAVLARDPACMTPLQPFLYFKGYLCVQAQRIAHWLWNERRFPLAFHIQSRVSELYAVDIHPAAPLGRGFFLDHAHGVVIGETARVDEDVSMLHGVTLGGTGKEGGDRHPKVESGVMIGAGAKVLGNITVGRGARIAAGSVVVKSVEPGVTVAGVPARKVGPAGSRQPSQSMDQRLDAGGSTA